MNIQPDELKKIENGDAWQDTDEVVELTATKPLDKVIPVRLPAGTWEKLRQAAKELGIGPTTLARMWIIERLKGDNPLQQDIRNLLAELKQHPAFPVSSLREKDTPYEKK